ncbi:MAG: hypothetical protein HQK61_07535, partial [Desulfamplus sp.]|nr:hypothetical protein [Desulfamplus sp.]
MSEMSGEESVEKEGSGKDHADSFGKDSIVKSGFKEEEDNLQDEDLQVEDFQGEENFADLLDSYDAQESHDIRQGDKINGTIIAIGKNSVYISTGSKSDGVVEKAELLDENGNFPYNVGDKIALYVVSLNESEVILSRALSGAGYAFML